MARTPTRPQPAGHTASSRRYASIGALWVGLLLALTLKYNLRFATIISTVVAIILSLIWSGVSLWDRKDGSEFEKFSNGAFHLVGACALIATAGWAILQQEWRGKISPLLEASTEQLILAGDKYAIVQLKFSIKNDGKITREFSDYRLAIRTFEPKQENPNAFGDLATSDFSIWVPRDPQSGQPTMRLVQILPGETDTIYATFRIPCTMSLVEGFGKLREPEPWLLPHRKMSYERKILIPLSKTCE
jgi:hypothetical protein